MSKLRKILLVVFLLVFLGSAAGIGYVKYQESRDANEFDRLLELMAQAEDQAQNNPDIPDGDDEDPDPGEGNDEGAEPQMLLKSKVLYEENSDYVGWIKIPGMIIDYPVMQSVSDNEYYLNRNFLGEYSRSGLPFLDETCDIDTSDNLLIHSHNMRNGTMFHSLLDYEDKAFWEDHPTIIFTTLYEEREYEIIAVIRSRILELGSTGFRYYTFTNAASEEAFDDFVDNIMSMSLYDTGLTAEYGDQLITLSTCSYHVKDGRFAVIAKLVEDD